MQDYVVRELKAGTLRFAAEDPDAPENFPRVLTLWRSNLFGSSSKGHEFFLKHLLGVPDAAVRSEEMPEGVRPEEVVWREEAPTGKLDLLTTIDFRKNGSSLYSDGEQDRYWQYATLFFLNQGQENGGYVTDEFLTDLAQRTPGLGVERWNERRNSGELEAKLQDVQDRASEAGIESTPTLVVSGPNGERELVGAAPAEEVTAAIEEVS